MEFDFHINKILIDIDCRILPINPASELRRMDKHNRANINGYTHITLTFVDILENRMNLILSDLLCPGYNN
jgi:hypothetical protein